MTYICVHWSHDFPTEPVWLYSELDDDRWEVRKVYVFPDGAWERADRDHNTDRVELSWVQVPDLEEIASDPQFEPRKISRDEFEKAWQKAENSN